MKNIWIYIVTATMTVKFTFGILVLMNNLISLNSLILSLFVSYNLKKKNSISCFYLFMWVLVCCCMYFCESVECVQI